MNKHIAPFQMAALLALTILWLACGNDKPNQPTGPQVDPILVKLNQMVSENPGDDSLLYLRAEYFYNQDAYDEAIRDLNAAIIIDSMQPRHYHLLADAFLDYGRPNDSKRAIEVLERATTLFPERTITQLKLSEFQLIVKKHGDALKTLDKILKRDPQNAEAYFMAGRVALDQGDTTNAVASLRQSLLFNADNVDGWIMLGRMLSERKDPQAIQCFDNALRLDSTAIEAKEFKGAYYKTTGQFDEAFKIYRDIVRTNPDYSYAFFDMGMIYLEMDSLRKAYDNFNLAIQTDPLFVKAYYFRGVVSELAGNIEEAKADYTQANKMSPYYPEPKAALERLQ